MTTRGSQNGKPQPDGGGAPASRSPRPSWETERPPGAPGPPNGAAGQTGLAGPKPHFAETPASGGLAAPAASYLSDRWARSWSGPGSALCRPPHSLGPKPGRSLERRRLWSLREAVPLVSSPAQLRGSASGRCCSLPSPHAPSSPGLSCRGSTRPAALSSCARPSGRPAGRNGAAAV